MAYNGIGTFVRIYNWVTDAANGILIRDDRMDTEMDGFATGLSNCITKDGQQTITANIPFSTYKITGLGNGSAPQDAVTYAQVFTSPTFTGTPLAPTAAVDTATTQIATTAYVVNQAYAKLASPTFTGVPLAPTAAVGTNTTQIATMAALQAQAFLVGLPSQAGNAGKAVITDGSTGSWGTLAALGGGTGQSAYAVGDTLYASGATALSKLAAGAAGYVLTSGGPGVAPSWTATGIKQITASATSITLTSVSTLAVMTPTTYGVSITLQDPSSDTPRDLYHAFDNKGAYPIRILNSAGTLLGFVLANNKCDAGLQTAGTPGTWSLSDYSLVGASAQLNSVNATIIDAVIDLGSNQEAIISRGISSANAYITIYNRSTNLFGSVTLIRTATFGAGLVCACLTGANQVTVATCPTGAATLQIDTFSISGLVPTPGTPATATLSANISSFAATGLGGLVVVTGGLVLSYTTATPTAELRGITISSGNPSLTAATTLSGTAGGLIVATADKVIAVSTAGTHLYTKPYTLSAGPTLTAGTGTDTNSSTMTLDKLAALGTRWYVGYNDGGGTVMGGVISLSGTTTTISAATLFSVGTLQDAIIVGTTKVVVCNNQTTSNINILTDSAGTAGAGTAVANSTETARQFGYASGTNVVIFENSSGSNWAVIDCSGSSPVVSYSMRTSNSTFAALTASNALLSRATTAVFGTAFLETTGLSSSIGAGGVLQVSGASATLKQKPSDGRSNFHSLVHYRGKLDSERWASDSVRSIVKVECVA